LVFISFISMMHGQINITLTKKLSTLIA
jgi:hypothetical protein